MEHAVNGGFVVLRGCAERKYAMKNLLVSFWYHTVWKALSRSVLRNGSH